MNYTYTFLKHGCFPIITVTMAHTNEWEIGEP